MKTYQVAFVLAALINSSVWVAGSSSSDALEQVDLNRELGSDKAHPPPHPPKGGGGSSSSSGGGSGGSSSGGGSSSSSSGGSGGSSSGGSGSGGSSGGSGSGGSSGGGGSGSGGGGGSYSGGSGGGGGGGAHGIQSGALKSKTASRMGLVMLGLAAVAGVAIAAMFAPHKRKVETAAHPLKGSVNRRINLFSHLAQHTNAETRPPRRDEDGRYINADALV